MTAVATTGLHLFARAWRITAGAAPAATAAVVALALVSAAMPIAGVGLGKVVVDRLVAGGSAMVPAALFGLTLVVGALARPLGRTLSGAVEERAVAAVDHRLMAVATRLVDLHLVERPAFHDELVNLRRASSYVPRTILLVGTAVREPLTIVGLFGLLVGLNPILALALAGVTLGQVIATGRMTSLHFTRMAELTRAGREMDYCALVTMEAAGAKEVRVFGLGTYFLDRFRQRSDVALAQMRSARLAELRTAIVVAVAHAAVVAGGFVYVADGAGTTPGDVALYIGAIVQVEAAAWGLSFVFSNSRTIVLNLRQVIPFLDEAGPAIALAPPGEGRIEPVVPTEGLAFDDVRFRYPETTALVLDGLSALVPAGKVTALIGVNGAGKSTVVKLLTRMYDPTSGAVSMDGHPLAAFDLDSWRQRWAAVHQDFARLSLTLGENVAVGAGGRGVATVAAVERANRWAGVDHLAARLPQGVETPLTRRFPGGVELSGGEWQKVALARGAVRDATFLVLDEPTAGLDPDAEYELFERFRQLVAGRTALLISHRFSTVRMADHVLVLDGGGVLEAGSHDQLIAIGGRYAELYEMQAGGYR